MFGCFVWGSELRMPARSNAIVYVETPVEFELEGQTVLADIVSGDWVIRVAMPVPVFLGSLAKAGLVAAQHREGAKVVKLRRAK